MDGSQNPDVPAMFREETGNAMELFLAMGDISKYQDKRLLAALSETGVNPAQYSYLSILCGCGEMKLHELAQRLHVKNPTASVTVKRMEKLGLVIRRPDPDDSRVLWIAATELGYLRFGQARGILSDYLTQIFGDFSEKDVSLLYQLLCRIRENVKNYIPDFEGDLKARGCVRKAVQGG